MTGVSIIIATRLVPEYLKECIQSIKDQIVNFKYEIILGVDFCESTLLHIKENSEFYSDLEIYSFNENVGPYIIKNNLVQYAKYDNLLFFDSDDIMVDGLLQQFYDAVQTADFVTFTRRNFRGTIKQKLSVELAMGLFGMRKKVFLDNIGFENWMCNADVEFLRRIETRGLKISHISEILCYRRIHSTNLTVQKSTNFTSDLRSKYKMLINKKTIENNWVNPSIILKEHTKINFDETFFT